MALIYINVHKNNPMCENFVQKVINKCMENNLIIIQRLKQLSIKACTKYIHIQKHCIKNKK